MKTTSTSSDRSSKTASSADPVDLDGDDSMFPLLHAKDVAKLFGVDTGTIHNLAIAGELPFVLMPSGRGRGAEASEGVRRRFRSDHVREVVRRWAVGELPGFTVRSRSGPWDDPDPRLPLLRARQVADLLGCNVRTVHNLAAGGYVPSVMLPSGRGAGSAASEGVRRRFRQDHVSELVERWTQD